MAMTSLTKLKRKHARENGKRAIRAINDSRGYTLVGNNTSYTIGLRKTSYESAHYAQVRAEICATQAARDAFAAHPELREGY